MNLSHQNPSVPAWPDILRAEERIRPYVHRTPVLTSAYFNYLTGGEIFFKCENFQKVGAFKIRGAVNTVLSIPQKKLEQGVVTHSSGNHAQAVALASKIAGTRAIIVMPENAPRVKIDAVKGYGADIVFCEPTIEARELAAEKIVREKGALFIHPYDQTEIIAGQGTAAKELLEEISGLDIILAPVGGGGLLSGTAIASKTLSRDIVVFGTEPEWADDAVRSLREGSLQPVKRTDTIADGLRTSLGKLPFSILRNYADDIITVSESSIVRAMRTVWERMKIVIEPSSAVPVAALTDANIDVSGKRVGIILTGGNVDLEKLPWQKPAAGS